MPTDKQIELAKSLNIKVEGKSYRVISAEIADRIEIESFNRVKKMGLKPGCKVEYVGPRKDLPKTLIVSSIGINGYVYFKGTSKYCRPKYLKLC